MFEHADSIDQVERFCFVEVIDKTLPYFDLSWTTISSHRMARRRIQADEKS